MVKQSIIIKKSPKIKNKEDAERIARKYADKIYTSRETESSYRFRQRDDNDFKQNSFKTDVINDTVSIVYGELKNIEKADNMPVPKPSGSETEQEFISRCMSDSNMQEYDKEQRAAICYNTFRGDKKTKSIIKAAELLNGKNTSK